MKRHMVSTLNNLIVLGCFLGLWQLLVSVLHLPAYMLPGPIVVGAAVVQRFPSLVQSLLLTSTAAALGLAGSVVVLVPVVILITACVSMHKAIPAGNQKQRTLRIMTIIILMFTVCHVPKVRIVLI